MAVCVITDNETIYEGLQTIIKKKRITERIDFFYSANNGIFCEKYLNNENFKPVLLREKDDDFFSEYGLYISLHCKQIFPENLVNRYRCINVHPGLNPYNRGWFPQVFSIINKLPVGVTIHEMDTKLDHGPIIYQKEIDVYDFETSFDIYKKIMETELKMLEEHIWDLINENYQLAYSEIEGNINYKADFEKMCRLNLNEEGTFSHFLDILRATTFPGYDNAYFYDNDGRKVYVSINLKKED